MNEEQSRLLGGVLGGAIDQVVRVANSLRIKLLDLKALEAMERNDVDDLPLLSYLQVKLPDGDGCYVPTGESEELDRVVMLASRADSSLRAGDLGEAVSLVLQCHQALSAETTRLLGIELGKKADEMRELQKKRHARRDAALDFVTKDWLKNRNNFASVRKAAIHYANELIEEGLTISSGRNDVWSLDTIADWIYLHASENGIKLR